MKHDDELIFDLAIDNVPHYKDTILVSRLGANCYVEKVLRTIAESEKNPIKLDSIRQVYGIKDFLYRDALLNLVYRNSDCETEWDIPSGKTWKFVSKQEADVFISKPIYMKDSEFAAVEIRFRNLGLIQVYRKINGVWTEFGTMCPIFFGHKAKFRKPKE
ncbi:hypothetical protein HUK80_10640 [Flavobacterium sp. MAH-1]|uniref:Uncharacterized protein n=1 Tax=Flavobacterium agri TaxID=2743471 RepID=A0A7Y8Y2H0_9FLAO|nr:hypothetical protein [Flavobacterium agri]NUY81355.1 hypothetical protein [Flavobacterium agri]NYA71379.1 hypothetical protein [Flavobacterium agri]